MLQLELINEIEDLITNTVKLFPCDSDSLVQKENKLLGGFKSLGYNWESDEELTDFSLGASDKEIWRYHLKVTLPKLKELHQIM